MGKDAENFILITIQLSYQLEVSMPVSSVMAVGVNVGALKPDNLCSIPRNLLFLTTLILQHVVHYLTTKEGSLPQ